ncbi:MAG: flagellar protein FlgN [Oligoflexia bacterium]|nr:flagellar protein FlgN [Oligoflexia bacterium]
MSDTPRLQGLQEFYVRLVALWRSFCERHTELFSVTCDEYSLLLTSEVDALESLLAKKDELIFAIGDLDQKRRGVIAEINLMNSSLGTTNIKNVSDLIQIMKEYEENSGENYLSKYNSLLIDIIEKIQNQNKKNQIFLNRSIISLREVREGILGRKSYSTYNSQGQSNLVTLRG